MLDGLRIRSKTILSITPEGHGSMVKRAPTKIHLMERPPGRKARAKKTLCGITISWRPFAQTRLLEHEATCRRCLAVH